MDSLLVGNNSETVVFQYLVASDPSDLVRLQLENNVMLGRSCDYQITPFKNKLYAWFKVDVEDWMRAKANKAKLQKQNEK